MLKIFNPKVANQIKKLVKNVAVQQGGVWVEKNELRKAESSNMDRTGYNPKTSRTRSF
ncbi:MAG: hypothetical protein IPN89_08630 [Saprospiraceae bacterium]|nr:hypothetical protein [Saprospiraceae bacterium]